MKKILLSCLILFVCFAQDSISLPHEAMTKSTNHSSFTPLSSLDVLRTPAYLPNSKWGYIGTSAMLTIAGSLAGAGILFLMPESVTKWDKEDIKNLGSNYLKKISNGPVVDKDEWWLNWITHPYWGAVYYLQARRAGFNWGFSAFYSFLCSTFFWEYGIEAFAETPSWQDLVVTPALGAFFGELFYLGINYIQNHDSKLWGSRFMGGLVLFLLDPLGFIIQDLKLGQAIGIKNTRNFQSFYLPKKDGITFVATYRW